MPEVIRQSQPAPPPKQDPQSATGDENGTRVQAPAITLPKGGGAIRGIGEKFAANPVMGSSVGMEYCQNMGKNLWLMKR